jgi:hypothetical protein
MHTRILILPMARIVAKVAAPAAPARNRGRGRAAPRAISPVNAHDATRSRQGGVMATYFIFGAVGQCPACADHRFSGPATLAPETSVTCHKCGHACTIKTAIETALASGAVKKLSDHRVVHGS